MIAQRRTPASPLRWVVLGMAGLLLAGGGCSSHRKVTRIESDATTDLSGRWNDTDSRLVAEKVTADCLNAPWLAEHLGGSGKRPVVIVGSIRNQSLEHVPTGTFVADIERAFVNSGKVEVVATAQERIDLRGERADQWENAAEETIKRMGRERGADYMLIGTVQSIEDREGGTKVVYYQVDLTLAAIETNRKVWIGGEKIKKEIRRSRYSP